MSKIIKSIEKGINKTVNNTVDKVEDKFNDTKKKIVSTVNKTVNLASRVILNTKQLPPYVSDFLKQNGNNKVINMVLARSTVPIAIRKLMVGLSGAKDRVLYHLYLIVTMENGKRFIIEKNERINISTTVPKAVQLLNVNGNGNEIYVKELITKTKQMMGNQKFFNYNASSNNCQVFIANVLKSNGLLNDENYAFIKQDTSDLFARDGNLRMISNTVVNEIAGRANILMNGGNIKTKKVNKWLLHVAKYRKANPELSLKQLLKKAKETYNKQ